MNYLALGDSISIDDYTGVPKGGAVSQLAALMGVETLQDLTRDGCTTDGVLAALDLVMIQPDLVTLTAGGNDFLVAAAYGQPPMKCIEAPLANLYAIADRLSAFRCRVILNTIYDPTDGDDELAEELGVPTSFRPAYVALNEGIRALTAKHGFILSDLELLFRGHGIASLEPWIVMQIEPNYAGASTIARHWYELLGEQAKR